MDSEKKILIIGAGAVGHALMTILKNGGLSATFIDPEKGYTLKNQPVDIIHYTVPMVELDSWVNQVTLYRIQYPSKYFIVEASIIPYALSRLNPNGLIYSPIRANEATMEEETKTQVKFWAFAHLETYSENSEITTYFNSIYPQGHQQFECAESLAFGKMLEVVDFGLQILFAQQV